MSMEGTVAMAALLLDHRELSSTVAVHLRQLGVPLEVGTLTTGDYLIGDDILIERKTGKDLAASIRDGRMLAQMRRLAGSNHTALLLLEDPEDLGGSAMRREAIDGLIITLALEFGIPVLPTRCRWFRPSALEDRRPRSGTHGFHAHSIPP